MASHQISIREDVYKKLVSLKKENESFSDVIDRLSQHAKGTWDTLEKFSGIGGEDTLELESAIKQNRTELEHHFKKRLGVGGS